MNDRVLHEDAAIGIGGSIGAGPAPGRGGMRAGVAVDGARTIPPVGRAGGGIGSCGTSDRLVRRCGVEGTSGAAGVFRGGTMDPRGRAGMTDDGTHRIDRGRNRVGTEVSGRDRRDRRVRVGRGPQSHTVQT